MERNAEHCDDLVHALYDAALDPGALGDALARITEWIDGDTCHLVGWNKATGQPTIRRMIGLREEVGSDYARRQAANDPRLKLAMTRPPGSFIRCHEHFDQRFVNRSEFFQDYLLPMGIHHLLGSSNLSRDPREIVVIGFQRYIGHRPFGDEELKRVGWITPHLQRALALVMRQEGYREAASVGELALDRFDDAVFVLGAGSHIVFANQRARALMRDCTVLSTVGGHLRSPAAPFLLADALDRVLETGIPRSLTLLAAGAAETGHSDAPRQMHCLNISRLPLGHCRFGDASGDEADLLLVIVTSPDRQRVVSVRQLMQLFQLTPAEARVAHALASGQTLEAYSRDQAVKITTARTQLRGVFAKTGVNSQPALQRLLAMLPSVRASGPG